jgi:hypothetical protein
MPVWGIWHDESVWFSSSVQSRKAGNLRSDSRYVVTTDNPSEPVVVEGWPRGSANWERSRSWSRG